MNQQNIITYRTVNCVADVIIFSGAFVCSAALVGGAVNTELSAGGSSSPSQVSSAFLALCFYGSNLFSLAYLKAYYSSRMRTYWSLAAIYTKAVILGLLIVELIESSYPYVHATKPLLPLASFFALILLFLKEVVLRRGLRMARRQGFYTKRALFVGRTKALYERAKEECAVDPLVGLELVGFVGEEAREGQLGEAKDIGRLIDENGVAAVICLADEIASDQLILLLQECEIRGVQVFLRLEILDGYLNRTTLDHFVGHNFLTLHGGPSDGFGLMFKSLFDRAVSALLLIVLSPFLLMTALAVRMSSSGPILFRQLRAGQDGKPFLCLKFRTMAVGSEEMQEQLSAYNEMEGPVFKMTDDPRVTSVGRFLRRTSIDELPQLWNVVCGSMSLVGPRPLPLKEANSLSPWHRRRLRMKPGITGLWQVSGRNTLKNFNEWVELDLGYIDNWSFALDLKLLLRTILVVLGGRGAH